VLADFHIVRIERIPRACGTAISPVSCRWVELTKRICPPPGREFENA
jgi:hypothetical protein